MELIIFPGKDTPLKRYSSYFRDYKLREIQDGDTPSTVLAHSLGIVTAINYCRKYKINPRIVSIDGSNLIKKNVDASGFRIYSFRPVERKGEDDEKFYEDTYYYELPEKTRHYPYMNRKVRRDIFKAIDDDEENGDEDVEQNVELLRSMYKDCKELGYSLVEDEASLEAFFRKYGYQEENAIQSHKNYLKYPQNFWKKPPWTAALKYHELEDFDIITMRCRSGGRRDRNYTWDLLTRSKTDGTCTIRYIGTEDECDSCDGTLRKGDESSMISGESLVDLMREIEREGTGTPTEPDSDSDDHRDREKYSVYMWAYVIDDKKIEL